MSKEKSAQACPNNSSPVLHQFMADTDLIKKVPGHLTHGISYDQTLQHPWSQPEGELISYQKIYQGLF